MKHKPLTIKQGIYLIVSFFAAAIFLGYMAC